MSVEVRTVQGEHIALAGVRLCGCAGPVTTIMPSTGENLGDEFAFGHPPGMPGARLALTATEELHRQGGRYARCTMYIGVGQSIALMVERV